MKLNDGMITIFVKGHLVSLRAVFMECKNMHMFLVLAQCLTL